MIPGVYLSVCWSVGWLAGLGLHKKLPRDLAEISGQVRLGPT